MNQKTIGVLYMLAVALLWALEPIAIRYSYRTAGPMQTAAIAIAVVAIIGFLYALVSRAKLSISRVHLPVLLYLAVIGSVAATTLYFIGIGELPVLNAVLLIHLQPIFIVLLGYFFLRGDRLTPADYLGICCMILAGIVVTARTLAQLTALQFGTRWDLLILLATFLWATTGILTRKYLIALNSGVITVYRFGTAALILLSYLAFKLSLTVNRYAVLAGIIGGIGYICYYEGIKRLKAAQVGALELASPFFAAVFGFAVFGETLTILQLGGMLLLCVGVYFLAKHER